MILVPPGTKITTHKNPGNISSWDLNGTFVWYNIPDMERYIYHHLVVTKTGEEKINDMVNFYPRTLKLFTVYGTETTITIKKITTSTTQLL